MKQKSKPKLNEDAYDMAIKNLGYAIVERAVKDYKFSLNNPHLKNSEGRIRELERFFKSDYCRQLSPNYHGDTIIYQIKKAIKCNSETTK